MVQHVKEGQDQYGISRSDEIVGAIFHRSSNPCEVNVWRLCYDITQMLSREPKDVIYGGSGEEIESEVWKRHPVEGDGVTLITKVRGCCWEIERIPRLMEADLGLLHQACAQHKRVLVSNDLIALLGGGECLVRQGFLLAQRNSRSAQLVRYNPRQVAINRWKQETTEIDEFFQPEFPPALIQSLFEAVRPDHWPHDHPYHGLLEAQGQVTCYVDDLGGGWGRHRRRQPTLANRTNAARTILAHVEIARKLSKSRGYRRPWRQYHRWNELLGELAEYVRGVERRGNDDWRKLARWLRSEARAAGVKIPPLKKLPPRPRLVRKIIHTPRALH